MTEKKKAPDIETIKEPDPFGGFDAAEPEDAAPKDRFNYGGLTFGERLAMIREDKGYIQKMTREGMDYSAVLYEALVEQVRPLFLRYGVSWHTHNVDVVSHNLPTEFQGLLVSSTLMLYTIRFQCVEVDSELSQGNHRDVIVPATAFDVFDPGAADPRGDTGAATATTIAQKYAIRQILNLAAGEDPDFTPMLSLSTRLQEERKTLILRLKGAIKAQNLDVDTWINKIIENTNTKHHRSIANVEDVETGILRQWVLRAEDKAKEATNGNGNDGSPGSSPGRDGAKASEGSEYGEAGG